MSLPTDIEEAHALIEALRADHAELLSLVQTSPGALVSFRRLANGRSCFPFMSNGALQLFGFSAAQLKHDAEPLLERIHPDDRARFYETNAASAASNSGWRCEFRYQHESKAERWIVGNSMPIRGPDDDITWSGVFFDITGRKKTEESLALAEAHLRSAFDAAEMGAWVFDAERGKMWGNRNQRELWQTPEDAPEWFDVSISDSQIHPDDRARAEAELAGVMTGEPLRNEFRIIRADGSVRWIAARARAETDPAGRRKRVAGVNIDITQQRLSTEQALRSQKLEALGTLAGGIAHDFNNVLFSILGNAGVGLAVQETGGDTRPMLLEIEAAARRAADLVRQILAFSRPQEQQTKVMELAGPVRDALKLVRATTSTTIALESDFDPSTPAIAADPSRLIQVVVNLCTNAVHAIGKERAGRVQVQLMPVQIEGAAEATAAQVPEGRYALLAVSDNGCGMDDATQARIYDPFFTTKPPGEGTGLGLSVVHGIMKAFGAHITVTSQVGIGTCFRLYFAAVEGVPTAQHMDVRAPVRGRGQRILFVDDEQMVVRLASQLLQSLGYTPEVYIKPERALAAFSANPHAYALVITDLSMPVLSGFELARAMLSIRTDLPVVLMSGNLSPKERTIAAEIGVRETVLKPPDLNALSELLARLC